MPSVGSTAELRAGNELGLLTNRVTPEHYNDLGNELALSTQGGVTGATNDIVPLRKPTNVFNYKDRIQDMTNVAPNNFNVNQNYGTELNEPQFKYPMAANQNWMSQMANGGRAGYQGGELVTDESMMEATPAGFMQENVEEVQGEPSREQLEALAMEIFQLPLEELNEEQLMIVYQAAMEQQPREEMMQEEDIQFAAPRQPMEEDIQQEDIQYAAQGGLAGLL